MFRLHSRRISGLGVIFLLSVLFPAAITPAFSEAYFFITKWGSYGSGGGLFDKPSGVAVDGSGNVYVVDTYNHRVQKFTSDGTFLTKWGTLGSGDGQFNAPRGVAVDKWGYVYVADFGNNRVQKFKGTGAFVTKWGSYGSGDGQFNEP